MGIQINGQTDTVTSTTAGGSVKVTPATINATGLSTFSGGINVGTGASISSPATNVLTLGTNNAERIRVGAAGSVGIGTADPPDLLTVLGRVQIQNDSTSNSRLVLRGQPSSSYRWSIDNYSSSNDFRIFRENDATAASGVVYVNVDSSGRVTTPYQPRAHITKTTGNTLTTSASKISFDAATYDIGSNYSDANDRYTAPVTGYYLVSSNINVINTTNNVTISVYKNGAVYGNMRYSCIAANVRLNYILVGIVYLQAGDYIEVFGIMNTGTVSVDNDGFLSIALLG